MKKEILGRYDYNEENEIIISIAAGRIEDLYNNFDRKSPFLKKDLSEDFVSYLIECVEEIDNEKFMIRIDVDSVPQSDSVSRITNSIHNYFLYLKELETKQMRSKAKTSLSLLALGLVFAFVALFSAKISGETLLWGVLTEGLTVAAWVSLWEALATFLIRWMPYKKKINLFERLSHANVAVFTEVKK